MSPINSNQLFLLLTLISFSFHLSSGCKITIKIKSETKNKFRIQLFIPSIKQKTEQVTFDGPEEKVVKISGENCMSQKWVFRTWKLDSKGDWVGAKQDSAKIDGTGWFRVLVDEELTPRMEARLGIFCSEGSVCG